MSTDPDCLPRRLRFLGGGRVRVEPDDSIQEAALYDGAQKACPRCGWRLDACQCPVDGRGRPL